MRNHKIKKEQRTFLACGKYNITRHKEFADERGIQKNRN